MKAYGFISTRTHTSSLVTIIGEDGHLIMVFEIKNPKKAPEVAPRFCPKQYEFEWCESPWRSTIAASIKNYEQRYGVTLWGGEAIQF